MNIHVTRRRLMATVACSLLFGIPALAAAQGAAQGYPQKPISIVLPYSAGTGIDAATRTVAESMQKNLKQPVIVLNRVGAGGNIGTESVAHAAPDGYSVLVVANTLAMNPSLYRNLRYNPLTDLAPVGLMLKSAMVLVEGGAAPKRDLRAIIESSRKEPGKLNYSSSGVGTPQHLAMEMLKSVGSLDASHIPHKGAGEAVMSVAGGQVDLSFVPLQSALPLISSGKLRAIAVSSPQRSPLLADVPTISEVIGAPFDVDLWYGMFVPAATPPQVIDTLAREIRSALSSPGFQSKFAALGMSTSLSTPIQLADLTKADMQRWAALIRQSNITAE